MSNPGRVSLELRGDAKDGEHVRLQEFVEKLSALQTALTNTERLITERKPNTFYKVVNLSHNSPATIELEHRPGRWFMRANDFVTVRGASPVPSTLPVSCGIPGHDHPGDELRTDLMRVADDPLLWEVHGRCGFASDFDYASDAA